MPEWVFIAAVVLFFVARVAYSRGRARGHREQQRLWTQAAKAQSAMLFTQVDGELRCFYVMDPDDWDLGHARRRTDVTRAASYGPLNVDADGRGLERA